jgi:hypothetical protein
MSIVVQFSTPGSVRFDQRWVDADVRDVQKIIRALRAAYSSETFELYDLERETTFFKARLTGKLPTWIATYETLVNDASKVAAFYRVDLRLPERPTHKDLESLSTLVHLIDGNLPLDTNNITVNLAKTANIDPAQAEALRGEGNYMIRLPEYFERPVLFSVPVCSGPIALHIPRARVENPEEAYRFCHDAPIGESYTLTLKPLGPAYARAIHTEDQVIPPPT